MEEIIIQFIKKQTCASICCADKKGNPYCFSCFYAFNSDEGLLYYKSSSGTRHSELISENPSVAGTDSLCRRRHLIYMQSIFRPVK